MPLLIGPKTIDSPSINGPCLFPAKPVSSPFSSVNVFFNKQLVKFVHSFLPPDTVEGTPWIPLPSGGFVPCIPPLTPALRIVVTSVNKSVFINKFAPAVQGDATELTSVPGTKRIFVAPFQHPNIFVANTAK
jgi:hypothetical protein